MAIPPFQDFDYDPKKHDQGRLGELFENARRNFEDLYNRYVTSEQVQEKVGTKKEFAGAVGSGGSIEAGSGFTIAHPSTGSYTVTLKEKLSGFAVLVPVLVNGGGEAQFIFASGPNQSVWTVSTFNGSFVGKNGGFTFIIRQT